VHELQIGIKKLHVTYKLIVIFHVITMRRS